MKVERVVTLERDERAILDYIFALRDTEEVLKELKWKAVRDAYAMGIPMREIHRRTGLSTAQVSRINAGMVKG